MPLSSRKTSKAAYESATAHASVKIMNPQYATSNGRLRPKYSELGPQTNGPRMYPIRKIEMGRTRAAWLVMLNSSAIWGMALLQIDEPMVLFMTCMTPAARTKTFLVC